MDIRDINSSTYNYSDVRSNFFDPLKNLSDESASLKEDFDHRKPLSSPVQLNQKKIEEESVLTLTPPLIRDSLLKKIAVVELDMKWLHHRPTSPGFLRVESNGNLMNDPANSEHYILKIAKNPHRQAFRKTYSGEEIFPESVASFSCWNRLKQQHAAQKLKELGVPLEKNLTELVYRLLHDNQRSLCQNEAVAYPAKYEAIAAYKKKKGEKEILHFELEVSSKIKATLIFTRDENFCVGIGGYKKAWKVFSLQEPALRVQTFSILHFSREQAQKFKEERNSYQYQWRKVLTYHQIANREEECFERYGLYAQIAKAHQIFYYKIHERGVDYQQQIIEMDHYPLDLFSFVYQLREANLKGNSPSIREKKLNLTEQILQAVIPLHRDQRIFRDLKLENFLMKKEEVYLTDFGYCVTQDYLNAHQENSGSMLYFPPEVIQSDYDRYSEKLDVWAIGCILWLLWFDHDFPWYQALDDDRPKFKKALAQMETFEKSILLNLTLLSGLNVPENSMQAVIYNMLRFNPADRLSLVEALTHVQSIKERGKHE